MKFCFVWIKWLFFSFCRNQCAISVVKFSKTHTMVVNFPDRSRSRWKKTDNATALELWSLSPEIITESSIFLLVYLFWCCRLCSTSTKLVALLATREITLKLSQKDRWCLLDITSFRSLIRFSLFLLIIITPFFSKKISSISTDCLGRNCNGRLHCSLWIFRVLSVHYYHKIIFPPKTYLV